jgi:PmbA protein
MSSEKIKSEEVEKAVDTLREALSDKADSYEIFVSMDKGLNAEVKDNEVDSFKLRSSIGIGIRTLSAGRGGFGYSSLFDLPALRDMMDKTLSGSLELPIDRMLSFPAPEEVGEIDEETTEDIVDPSITEGTGDSAVERARLIEDSARSVDAQVDKVRKASYSESSFSTRLVNSNGVDCFHYATFFSGSVSAVATKDEESQIAWEIAMGHKRADVDPEFVGRSAAVRALAQLGARPAVSGRTSAVIENAVAVDLLQAFSGAFLGDNVTKGKSMLSGLIGKDVVSKAITINDDGLLKGGWAKSVFDGEGVRRSNTALITEGKLKGFLYDTYWAKVAGMQSTGNASRGDFKGAPSVGVSNISIAAGEKDLDELLAELGEGIFITELMGAHTINTITGEFSVGAQGFKVEGGKVQYPVRGMAIAGDLLSLFSKVQMVGSDLRFIGGTGAPALLLSELDVSGSS